MSLLNICSMSASLLKNLSAQFVLCYNLEIDALPTKHRALLIQYLYKASADKT